jgi:DHA1 family tetracycline resistance protein-like MFS transporter
MPAVWAFYTKYRFEWSEATIGASLALAGALMALSQATLVRVHVPRWGERRTALTGIAVACVGYVGYGFATQSWMMFAWLLTWLFGAMVMPTTNAYMSHQIEPDAQGELQGAVAGLYSLSSIAGPPIMTQLFARFTATSAPLHLPGAPFLAAAVLTACCFVLYALAARDRGARVPPEPAFEDAADVSGSAAEQPDRIEPRQGVGARHLSRGRAPGRPRGRMPNLVLALASRVRDRFRALSLIVGRPI